MAKFPGGPLESLKSRLVDFLRIFLLIAILATLTQKAQAQQAPEKTVEATGLSTVTGGDTALARDAALSDALRKAVEQAVGTLVSSETMVENYQVLSDNVYTKTQGYIKGYQIVREGQGAGLYQVTVKAAVAMGALKDDLGGLGMLQRRAEKPRVLFMVAEKNIGHKYYVFWWWGRSEYKGETVDISAAETALKEIFIDKGFNVVDVAGTTGEFNVSDAFRVSDLTRDGARQVGRGLNAEVVVFGKAMAKEGPRTEGSNVGTYLADVTFQAVRVDDGSVLASSRGHGVSRHISDVTGGTEAIAKASAEAADKMVEQIIARWSAGHTVTLKVSGVTDYRKLTDFKDALKGRVRGISAIYQRKFEGGDAVFEIDSKISAQSIADEASKLLNLKILRTTPNTIEAVME